MRSRIWRRSRTRSCSSSAGSPRCSATTAASTRSTRPSRRGATGPSRTSRACPSRSYAGSFRPREPRRGRPGLAARARVRGGSRGGARPRDPRGASPAPGAQSRRPLPAALRTQTQAQIWLIQAVSATLATCGRRIGRAGFLRERVASSQGRSGLYDVGDKVVYPHHGAGTVVKKEKREVLGEQREYLTIKILHNDMTVQVPSENADKVGLRRVIGEKEIGGVLTALTGVSTEMPKNWNRRFKHNRDKMKTGDVLGLAEVVRNLSLRDREKGLSTGEKQMFVKAKKILASELMYAKDMDEETARTGSRRCSAPQPDGRRSQRPRRRPWPRPPSRPGFRICPSGRSSSPRGGGSGSGWTGRRRSRSSATSRFSPSRCVASRLALGRRDRPGRAAGLGGACDPPRRGAGLRQGARVRDGRRDAQRLGAGRPRQRCPPTRWSCSCTTRRARSCRRR